MTKVALVTGATSKLGQAITFNLEGLASAVAIHYYSQREKALELAERLKEQNIQSDIFPADLTKSGAGKKLVREVEKKLGEVDILINNFGPILVKPWVELTRKEIESIWQQNVLSAWEIIASVLPSMRKRKWGRIINLGYSRVEELGVYPTILPYAMAKTSLLILTRTVARSEAPFGITVNMVSPGLLEDGELPRSFDVPMGRLGRFEEVTPAVKFLVSEDAAYITGVNLVVAGGWKL